MRARVLLFVVLGAAPARPGLAADRAEVAAALEAWRDAWQRRDLDAYMSFYVPEFRGGGRDRDGWREHKRQVFARAGGIAVELSAIRIRITLDSAVCELRQAYRSPGHSDVGRKTMRWQRKPDGWKIVAEEWQALPDEPGAADGADAPAAAAAPDVAGTADAATAAAATTADEPEATATPGRTAASPLDRAIGALRALAIEPLWLALAAAALLVVLLVVRSLRRAGERPAMPSLTTDAPDAADGDGGVPSPAQGSAEAKLLRALAAEQSRPEPRSRRLIDFHTTLGNLYERQRHHEEARSHLWAASELLSGLREPRDEERLAGLVGQLIEQAEALEHAGEPERAERLLWKIIERHAPRLGDRCEVARAHFCLGRLLVRIADQRREWFEQALPHLERAIAIAGQRPEAACRDTLMLALNSAAIAYEELQRPEKALATFQSALDVAREVRQPDSRAAGLIEANIGRLHWNQREMDDCRARFEKALPVLERAASRDERDEALRQANELIARGEPLAHDDIFPPPQSFVEALVFAIRALHRLRT